MEPHIGQIVDRLADKYSAIEIEHRGLKILVEGIGLDQEDSDEKKIIRKKPFEEKIEEIGKDIQQRRLKYLNTIGFARSEEEFSEKYAIPINTTEFSYSSAGVVLMRRENPIVYDKQAENMSSVKVSGLLSSRIVGLITTLDTRTIPTNNDSEPMREYFGTPVVWNRKK